MSLISLMASLPNYLAGNGDLGSWEPTQLFAGEADIVTDGGEVAVAFARYQVIAKNAAGKLVPYDPTTPANPEATAIGIANEAGVVEPTHRITSVVCSTTKHSYGRQQSILC